VELSILPDDQKGIMVFLIFSHNFRILE